MRFREIETDFLYLAVMVDEDTVMVRPASGFFHQVIEMMPIEIFLERFDETWTEQKKGPPDEQSDDPDGLIIEGN